MTRPLRILMSAGEASGDRLGAGLAEAIRQRRPDAELLGMGGDAMAAAGVRRVAHASDVAVVGIAEVASRLPALRRAMAALSAEIERERPDLVVPVDFPDFNLRLATRARRAGVPVVYFVGPSVWAWRRGRMRRIRRDVRRMLVLYPFEVACYEEAGVPVTFVGHPAVEEAGAAVRSLAEVGLEAGVEAIALLPGSRQGEIERLLPPMLGAAGILRRRRRHLHFVVPAASTAPRERIRSLVERSGLEGVHVAGPASSSLLGACVAGVVASGTATLEAALAGLPTVVVYRLSPVTYRIVRMLVRTEHVALPNLILGRPVVPELIQGACTPERIAEALERWLDRPDEAEAVREIFGELPERLGGKGALARAARAVLDEAGIPPDAGSEP